MTKGHLELVRHLKYLVASDAGTTGLPATLRSLLETIQATDLPRLDAEMRSRADWQTTVWDEMQPAQAALVLE